MVFFLSVGNIMMMAVGQAGKFQNGPRRHFTFKLMTDYSAEASWLAAESSLMEWTGHFLRSWENVPTRICIESFLKSAKVDVPSGTLGLVSLSGS